MAFYHTAQVASDSGTAAGMVTLGTNGSQAIAITSFGGNKEGATSSGTREVIIQRVTTSGTGSGLTAEKDNTRSGASTVTETVNFSTDPTKTGNALVMLPVALNATTGFCSNMYWWNTDPRQPIYTEPSAFIATFLNGASALALTDFMVNWGEDGGITSRPIRGRRGRTPGKWATRDCHVGQLVNTTAAQIPTNFMSPEFQMLQPLDWQYDTQDAQVFLNLLNGGPPPDENIQVKYMRTFFGGFR